MRNNYRKLYHERQKILEKTFTDAQKEIFEKFLDCWSEYASLSECADNQAKRGYKLDCERVSADCSVVVRGTRTECNCTKRNACTA